MRQFGNRSQLIAQRQAQVVRSETEWLIAQRKKEKAEALAQKEEAVPAEAASSGASSDNGEETKPGTPGNESSASGDDHGKRYYRKAEEAYAQSRLDFANDYLSKENPVALKIELRTAKKYWDFVSKHLVEEGVGNRTGDEIRPYSFDEFLAHATIKNGMVSIAAVGADNRTEAQKKEEPTADLTQTQEPAKEQTQEQESKPEPAPQNQTDQVTPDGSRPAVTEKGNEQKPIEVKEQGNISYERVATEKWNNTGFKFSARNGKVLTSGEVYKFIQEEKKKGNEEFITAFKPHIKGKDPENAYPTFEIAGSKIKFFAYSFDPEFGKKKEEDKKLTDELSDKNKSSDETSGEKEANTLAVFSHSATAGPVQVSKPEEASSNFLTEVATFLKEHIPDIGELAISLLPVIGDVYDVVTGILGKSLITKEKLDWTDRLLCLVGVIPIPFVSGALLRKVKAGAEWLLDQKYIRELMQEYIPKAIAWLKEQWNNVRKYFEPKVIEQGKEKANIPTIFPPARKVPTEKLLAKYKTLRENLSGLRSSLGSKNYLKFEQELKEMPEEVWQKLNADPEMLEGFAKRSLKDPGFLEAVKKGDVAKLQELEKVAARGVLNVEQRTLQHMFGRHAKDFGVTGNWSKAMAGEFEGVLRTHMKGLTPIQGTYRGTQQVLHYYNPSTGLNVMTDMSGNLVGGWKLSADQIKYLLSTGTVK